MDELEYEQTVAAERRQSCFVYQLIADAQADLSKIGIAKTDTNTYDDYKFRGIDALYDHLSQVLAKRRLMILPRVVKQETIERKSRKGEPVLHAVLWVEYDLCAPDGSKHTVCAVGEAIDRGDKAINKAFTAAYKYMAFQTFCIPIKGAMDDADKESHQIADREKELRLIADAIISHYAAGKFYEMYEEWVGIADNEEKMVVWGMLRPHSKIRTEIKNQAELEKQAEPEAA